MPLKSPSQLHTTLIVTAIVLVLFIGVFLFARRSATAFSCVNGGQSTVLQNSVMTFGCTEPRFIVSCDERTVAFYDGAFWCGSFNGRTMYKFEGTYQQVK